jgi:ribose transport system substrate-binding protein
MFRKKNYLAAAALAATLSLPLSGCGGTSNAGATSGQHVFTVGMTLPTAQNSTIQGIADGLRAEIEQHGGKLITADSQLSIDKQIGDIDQFVSQKVDAIMVFPLDLPTLKSVLGRADKAGIPLFAHDAQMEDQGAPALAPIRAEVVTGRKQQAQEAAKFIAEKTGGTGDVGAIGIAAPVTTNMYLLDQFKEQLKAQNGLTFADQKGNPTDDAAGARPLAEAFLTQYSALSAIYTYNDPSAIGAAAAVKAAAKSKKIIVTGFNASQDGLDAVKNGTIDATWDYKPVEVGQTLGRLIHTSVVEKKPIGHFYQMDVKAVTPENVASFVPWSDRVKQITEGKYLGLPID